VSDQSVVNGKTTSFLFSQRKDKGRGKESLAMSLLIADKGAAREGVRRKGRNLYMGLREAERNDRKRINEIFFA
jgi:hypothetical protein